METPLAISLLGAAHTREIWDAMHRVGANKYPSYCYNFKYDLNREVRNLSPKPGWLATVKQIPCIVLLTLYILPFESGHVD